MMLHFYWMSIELLLDVCWSSIEVLMNFYWMYVGFPMRFLSNKHDSDTHETWHGGRCQNCVFYDLPVRNGPIADFPFLNCPSPDSSCSDFPLFQMFPFHNCFML